MTGYFVYGLTTVICLALAWWAPEEGSLGDGLRSYFLVLIGYLLVMFGLRWALRHLGYFELTIGDGLLFTTLGAGTTVGAVSRFRPYWHIASRWPLFAPMSEGVRQLILTVLGLGLLTLGLHELSEGRQAYLSCRQGYQAASDSHERVLELQRVPSSSLRSYKGARPYTCGQLLEGQLTAR